MKRLKGAEVWTDQQGTVAIKRLDGDYNVYMHVDAISTGNNIAGMQVLSDFPEIQAHIRNVKAQILSEKLKKKLRKKLKKNEG